MKYSTQTTERILGILKGALDLGTRTFWHARVSRSEPGFCEVILDDESNRKLDLKQSASFLSVDEEGNLSSTSDVNRPQAGARIIVIPTNSRRDCARISHWGFENEMQDLKGRPTAIGSGKKVPKGKKKEVEEEVVDRRTSLMLVARVPRRNFKEIKALMKKAS